MKWINKNTEPHRLINFKGLASEDWTPCFSNLSKEVKEDLHNSLIIEQGYICCYCERRISVEDSHIEHLNPQSRSPEKALDYNNLLSSCQRKLERGEPLHCGNLKDNWYDEEMFVSPLDPACEERFSYRGDGRIAPSREGDIAAEQTILTLGLYIKKLQSLRSSFLNTFLDENLSDEDFKRYINTVLQKGADGKYIEFLTMIRYFFSPSSS